MIEAISPIIINHLYDHLPHTSPTQSPANVHDPGRFVPECWLPEAKNTASPFYADNRDVLQPFSTGPRNCIGKNLAYSEMRVILAQVLWNFDIELCEGSWIGITRDPIHFGRSRLSCAS